MASPASIPSALTSQPALLNFRHELFGGLNGAATALVITLAASALVFAPAGGGYLPVGIVSGLIAVVAGNLVLAALVNGRPSSSSPRAASCLVLAGFVGTLVRSNFDLDASSLIALTCGCVMVAGAFQLAFGVLRLGSLIRFVPYPVVSGFTNGIAIILFLGFAPLAFGIASRPAAGIAEFTWPHWGAFAIGVLTLGAIYWAERHTRALPSNFIGLLAGALAYAATIFLLPAMDPGALVGNGAKGAMTSSVSSVLVVPWSAAAGALEGQPHIWKLLIGHSLVLAFISSLDSMLGTLQIEGHIGKRFDPNRELIAHGFANIVSAAFGGLTVASSPTQLHAIHRAGGRGMPSGLVQSAALLAALATSPLWLRHMPLALLGAIMVVTAFKLADPWARDMLLEFCKKRRRDQDMLQSLGIVFLVAGLTVAVDFVTAIIVGIVLSGAIYVRAVNRSVIRSVLTGPATASRNMYDSLTGRYLKQALDCAAVVQIEGQLFFGSAERVATELGRLNPKIRFIVIDFQHVHGLDATSAIVLRRTQQRLKSQGRTVVFAHTQRRDFDQKLRSLTGARAGLGGPYFPDADRAMEWVESQLIAERANDAETAQAGAESFSIFARMSEDEKNIVRKHLRDLQTASGQILFNEGDTGLELYLLRAGTVGIYQGGKEQGLRLISFAAGTMFGEMSLLDRRPRAATGICSEPCSLYVLSREALDAVEQEAPAVAVKIYEAIAREVSQRLRTTNILLAQGMA